AVRLARSPSRDRLYALGTTLVAGSQRCKKIPSRQLRRLDRRIQARWPREPPPDHGWISACRKELGEFEPQGHLRRQYRCDRTQPEILKRDSPTDSQDGAAGR